MAPPLKPSTASLLVGTVLLGTVGAALATVSLGDNVGTTEDDRRAALTAQGYTILEFGVEDGDPEGKMPLDGREMEIGFDVTLDTVLGIEHDTEDDD